MTDITKAAEAFRSMAGARHIGKLVLRMTPPERVGELRWPGPVFRDDSTYLVTGGLGGLGLAAAEWLADQGAGALVLLGRSEPGREAATRLDALRSSGVDVTVEAVDVADEDAVAEVLDGIAGGARPLRGVLHAAGVLEDATLAGLDVARFRAPLQPKVAGAWNLHRLSAQAPLDFFVLYSSVAGVLGTSGQANYAAGNSFLDSLAGHRRAHGLPATSIAWGPWSSVGLAASADERGARLAAQGLGSLDIAEGMSLLGTAMVTGPACPVVMRFKPPTWLASHPAAASDRFFERLASEEDVDAAGGGSAGLAAALLGAGAAADQRGSSARGSARKSPLCSDSSGRTSPAPPPSRHWAWIP